LKTSSFRKNGTNELPGAIGTNKLPERQIKGSSYMGKPWLFKRNGGPHVTIFATFNFASNRNAQFLATVARYLTMEKQLIVLPANRLLAWRF
jgi:hypothetical protein